MSKQNKITRIEVELRSIFDKKKYEQLKFFLDKNAEYLGEDNKDVCFFILKDKFVKSVKNISKGDAKIVLKNNSITKGESDFEEIEIPISQSNFNKSVRLFEALPFDQIEWSYQKRHNYVYKGVELALKWTQSWGYHLELEIVTNSRAKVEDAKKKIERVAKELDVHIMTKKELMDFSKKADELYKKGKFKNKQKDENL